MAVHEVILGLVAALPCDRPLRVGFLPVPGRPEMYMLPGLAPSMCSLRKLLTVASSSSLQQMVWGAAVFRALLALTNLLSQDRPFLGEGCRPSLFSSFFRGVFRGLGQDSGSETSPSRFLGLLLGLAASSLRTLRGEAVAGTRSLVLVVLTSAGLSSGWRVRA